MNEAAETPEPRRRVDSPTIELNLEKAGKAYGVAKSVLRSAWAILVALVFAVWAVSQWYGEYTRNVNDGSPVFKAFVQSQTEVNNRLSSALELILAEQKRQAQDIRDMRDDFREMRNARIK